jgi:hypothetical protein
MEKLNERKTSENIVSAMDLAIEAHAGQVDKIGRSYLFHLTQVAGMTRTDEEFIVAWLHDYIEDSSFSREECIDTLREKFSREIVEAIIALTHAPDEPREQYIERVSKNRLASRIKYYDIRSNCDIIRLKKLPLLLAQKLVKKYDADVKQLVALGVLNSKQTEFMAKTKKVFLEG